MANDKMFRYVGNGAVNGDYRIGLPTRDLYKSDMARAAKQGWPRGRIEDELGHIYELVEAVTDEFHRDNTSDELFKSDTGQEGE